jgi:hypothetical protein
MVQLGSSCPGSGSFWPSLATWSSLCCALFVSAVSMAFFSEPAPSSHLFSSILEGSPSSTSPTSSSSSGSDSSSVSSFDVRHVLRFAVHVGVVRIQSLIDQSRCQKCVVLLWVRPRCRWLYRPRSFRQRRSRLLRRRQICRHPPTSRHHCPLQFLQGECRSRPFRLSTVRPIDDGALLVVDRWSDESSFDGLSGDILELPHNWLERSQERRSAVSELLVSGHFVGCTSDHLKSLLEEWIPKCADRGRLCFALCYQPSWSLFGDSEVCYVPLPGLERRPNSRSRNERTMWPKSSTVICFSVGLRGTFDKFMHV